MSLVLYYTVKPSYVAVSKYGYGIDQCPAVAIYRALEQVPADAPMAQLLIYKTLPIEGDGYEATIAPRGWKGDAPVWPNHMKPQLVGLTNTDQLWKARPH
jgi:hypothetical protein